MTDSRLRSTAAAVVGAMAALLVARNVSQGAEPSQTITNSIGMKLVAIPAGEFEMGAVSTRLELMKLFPYCDPAWIDGEWPRHHVRITKPFYMGQYEVTLRELLVFYFNSGYRLDCERDGKPSWGYASDGQTLIKSHKFRPWDPGWKIEQDHPAVYISWNDAMAFCGWLSKREKKSYRLATEAEWEYACRAGTITRYFFGNDSEQLIDYGDVADADRKAISGNAVLTKFTTAGQPTGGTVPFPFLSGSDGYAWTAPVGKYRPNAFGLYDTHGNVWEWCGDFYDENYYERSPVDDPQGPPSGELRVARGGGFYGTPVSVRCARRDRTAPSYRDFSRGFRVVCEQ
ncbi:MAG TPA: formylglycine-generating enzyme family protein [Pirellulales bacterium]|jgi:formylglycine-generating enzyme required for sulfatase activity|nr:formylglycine-generating enzyme family protein [Pirellulales bacterium]